MAILHEFTDYEGPVPAHQHSNGGGWIADTAKVAKTAYVGPEAKVFGYARVYNWAKISGSSKISGYAKVYGNAWVSGYTWISGYARIYGYARVSGDARVFGDAWVFGNAWISGETKVSGTVQISGDTCLNHNIYCKGIFLKTPIITYGSKASLILDSENNLQIGCKFHPIDYWLENYEEIGRKHRYTEEEIKEYGELIKDINRLYMEK